MLRRRFFQLVGALIGSAVLPREQPEVSAFASALERGGVHPGFVWAPYMPVYTTPVLVDSDEAAAKALALVRQPFPTALMDDLVQVQL